MLILYTFANKYLNSPLALKVHQSMNNDYRVSMKERNYFFLEWIPGKYMEIWFRKNAIVPCSSVLRIWIQSDLPLSFSVSGPYFSSSQQTEWEKKPRLYFIYHLGPVSSKWICLKGGLNFLKYVTPLNLTVCPNIN